MIGISVDRGCIGEHRLVVDMNHFNQTRFYPCHQHSIVVGRNDVPWYSVHLNLVQHCWFHGITKASTTGYGVWSFQVYTSSAWSMLGVDMHMQT